MKNIKFYRLVSCLLFCFSSHIALAHDGPHDDECEIVIGQQTYNIIGYQLQSTIPNRHYCRIFPELGKLKFQLQPDDANDKSYPISLKVLGMASGTELLNIFNKVIIDSPGFVDSEGNVSFEVELTTIGPYNLEFNSTESKGVQQSNNFMILVGIPTAKILVGFCGLLFLYLIVSTIKQSYYPKH